MRIPIELIDYITLDDELNIVIIKEVPSELEQILNNFKKTLEIIKNPDDITDY
jgi:hypothetical protein